MDLTRRDMLKLGALGVVGTAGASQLPLSLVIEAQTVGLLAPGDLPRPFRNGFVRPPVLRPDRTARDPDGVLTDFFTIAERARRARILPTMATAIWGYDGIAPGPTIKVSRGRRAVCACATTCRPFTRHSARSSPPRRHLHGSASLPQYDGYASDVTAAGCYKDYHYPNLQPARTLWYHDHAAHHTARNVYAGLYAQYHVHDRAEQRPAAAGRVRRPLTVDDARSPPTAISTFDDRRARA